MSAENPFWVIGVSPDATPGEIEREGRKVLALIEVGAARGLVFEGPGGPTRRDATMVREAIAALRDPLRRARWATLARLLSLDAADRAIVAEKGHAAAVDAPLPGALARFGFKGL